MPLKVLKVDKTANGIQKELLNNLIKVINETIEKHPGITSKEIWRILAGLADALESEMIEDH